jgi:hypothetical protein
MALKVRGRDQRRAFCAAKRLRQAVIRVAGLPHATAVLNPLPIFDLRRSYPRHIRCGYAGLLQGPNGIDSGFSLVFSCRADLRGVNHKTHKCLGGRKANETSIRCR